MKCSNCGTENMDSMAFCTVCGTAMATNSPVSAPVPPAPVQNVAPAANPAQVSAPTAVADPFPPAYQATQMGPGPMQGPPMGPGPMQGPPMGPGPMQGPPMGPGPMQGTPMAPPLPPILECGQCKKPFGPDEPFCTNCGAPRQMAIARPASVPGAKKSSKTIIIIVIAIVVLIGLAFGVYALIRENNYKSAIDQMNMGNYDVAYEAFEKLGDYKESAYYSDECYLYVRYYEAIALMDEGKYLDAKAIFDEIEDFQDSYQLAQDCLDYIEYDKAIGLYNNGEFYQAYKIFDKLYDFKDSAEWAEKCIQPTPSSGVVEQGPAYAAGTGLFGVQNNSWDSICVILYTESGSYWGMIFVAYFDVAIVEIATGRYYVSEIIYAYIDYWFGPKDMFGDNGTSTGPVTFDGEAVFEITEEGVGFTYN